MSMTTPAPETNPEGTTNTVNPYAGLPKPPMAPPSKATERIPLIMSSSTTPQFAPGIVRFLEKKGVDLEKLKFRSIRLIIKSIDGGWLSGNGGHEFYFSVLGRLFEKQLVLQVVETARNTEIEEGHMFYDINALEQLVSSHEKPVAGYPIISLEIEENN